MKNKKLFAILTLVAFMLTMMPVMAFATTADDVFAWVEEGSAKAGATDEDGEVVAYLDFDELRADERIYVYAVKAGQVYEEMNYNNLGKAWAYYDNGLAGENKIVLTNGEAAVLTLKAVLVKDIEGSVDFSDLTIHQVNKATHDGYTFTNIEVEDATITFKGDKVTGDGEFEVVSIKPYINGEYKAGAIPAANGGVDYYKVSVKLLDVKGDVVKKEEVSIDLNKIGVAVSETEVTTNNRGVAEFNVYATKNGVYEITLSADDTEDYVIKTVNFGVAALGTVAPKAQPVGVTATGSDLNIPLNVTDTNGNNLAGATGKQMAIDKRSIQVVAAPEDADYEAGDIIKVADDKTDGIWFDNTARGVVRLNINMDEAGDYTFKIYDPSTGGDVQYVYCTFAEFDKAVSATVAYDSATYMLGADVEVPTVKVFDANGTSRNAEGTLVFSYSGVGVDGFSKANGSFSIVDDDKYLGQQIVISVTAEKCYATTSMNIADVPAYLQFTETNAAVGTNASVPVASLDLKGNVAALGNQYTIGEVSSVVTAKPEGAIVNVDLSNITNLAQFKTSGTDNIFIASNKEGTVTVNVVVEATTADNYVAAYGGDFYKATAADKAPIYVAKADLQEGQTDYRVGEGNDAVTYTVDYSVTYDYEAGDTVFLTGIATVNFGGKVTTVSSSATLIIDSNVFVVNGGVKTAPVAPTIVDGRTYLPIRALGEALGATVDYVDGVITIKLGNTVATMTVGSNVMTVGAETVQMDAAPYVVDGTTMVPVRYAATALGYDIEVGNNADGTVATVTVYKK